MTWSDIVYTNDIYIYIHTYIYIYKFHYMNSDIVNYV